MKTEESFQSSHWRMGSEEAEVGLSLCPREVQQMSLPSEREGQFPRVRVHLAVALYVRSEYGQHCESGAK